MFLFQISALIFMAIMGLVSMTVMFKSMELSSAVATRKSRQAFRRIFKNSSY